MWRWQCSPRCPCEVEWEVSERLPSFLQGPKQSLLLQDAFDFSSSVGVSENICHHAKNAGKYAGRAGSGTYWSVLMCDSPFSLDGYHGFWFGAIHSCQSATCVVWCGVRSTSH
jgi:hypothetical protein